MTKITAKLIKEVREATGSPIMRAKQVLQEQKGDKKAAIKILREEGFAKTEKRAERATGAGIVAVYQHHNKKVSVLVELLAETDFVAQNELFVECANNIALQVASMNPKDEKELLSQDFIKDPTKKIEDLIKEVIAKTGENVNLGRFHRVEVGN